jgi:hypothetical protein
MGTVDSGMRAMWLDLSDLDIDRFGLLGRAGSLASERAGGHAAEMVRAAVDALAASIAGASNGFVAPGASGARAMLELARGFAVECGEFERLAAVAGSLDMAGDTFEALEDLEGDAAGVVPDEFARVCREFGEWARRRAVELGGYDRLDAALVASDEWRGAVHWAGTVAGHPLLSVSRCSEVVRYLESVGHRVVAAETGACDLCGGVYALGADDHNGETGCHFECEAAAAAGAMWTIEAVQS